MNIHCIFIHYDVYLCGGSGVTYYYTTDHGSCQPHFRKNKKIFFWSKTLDKNAGLWYNKKFGASRSLARRWKIKRTAAKPFPLRCIEMMFEMSYLVFIITLVYCFVNTFFEKGWEFSERPLKGVEPITACGCRSYQTISTLFKKGVRVVRHG